MSVSSLRCGHHFAECICVHLPKSHGCSLTQDTGTLRPQMPHSTMRTFSAKQYLTSQVSQNQFNVSAIQAVSNYLNRPLHIFSQCSRLEKKEERTNGEANFSVGSVDIDTVAFGGRVSSKKNRINGGATQAVSKYLNRPLHRTYSSDGGDGGDKKQKSFEEEAQAIHEDIWNDFFSWLGKKWPWFVSKLGYLITKASAARRFFLEFIHWQGVGSRGRQVFSNEEALKIIVEYLASKTAALSLTAFGKIGRYIWDYSLEFVLFTAVVAAFKDRVGKAYRFVGRWLGFEMEEPIDEAKAQKEALQKLVIEVGDISERLCKVEVNIGLK